MCVYTNVAIAARVIATFVYTWYLYNVATYCALSSPSGSNHTHAKQTMPTIRSNVHVLEYQMQAMLGSGLIPKYFETRLSQSTLVVDAKENI